MADPVLKFPPEQKGDPPAPARPKLAADPRRRLMAGLRRYRRFLLLVVLPLVAAMAGFTLYLNGGRYVTTDNAYVGAQKVLITPDVSGKIISVTVKDNRGGIGLAVRNRNLGAPGGAGRFGPHRQPRSHPTCRV